MIHGTIRNVLVSACLIGENCKYNGKNNFSPYVAEYLKDKKVITVCPEMLGGLGVPRCPAELVNGRAVDNHGNDVDEAFRSGAAKALEKIQNEKIDLAILQPRSPSCGVRQIYDGTFTGRLIDGRGLFAELLAERGIQTADADDIAALLKK